MISGKAGYLRKLVLILCFTSACTGCFATLKELKVELDPSSLPSTQSGASDDKTEAEKKESSENSAL